MDRLVYHVLLLFAIAFLESLPRFLFETQLDFPFVNRVLLLGIFLLVGWFFRKALQAKWRWSILSSMFFVDAIAAICLAILLFGQFFTAWFAVITAVIIIGRNAVFAYLMTDRLENQRNLVFFTCFILLVVGELVITFGFSPF